MVLEEEEEGSIHHYYHSTTAATATATPTTTTTIIITTVTAAATTTISTIWASCYHWCGIAVLIVCIVAYADGGPLPSGYLARVLQCKL